MKIPRLANNPEVSEDHKENPLADLENLFTKDRQTLQRHVPVFTRSYYEKYKEEIDKLPDGATQFTDKEGKIHIFF